MKTPTGKPYLAWHQTVRASAVRWLARTLRIPTVVEYNRLWRYK